MNIKKKIVSVSLSLLVLSGTMVSAYAYSYVEGTHDYQYVTFYDIPGGGKTKSNISKGSKKMTTGTFATFKKTFGEAALGNFGELINASKSPVSAIVGMPLNTPTLSVEKKCSKGVVYFSAVTSSGIEPSNSCDVTMGFSADNLK